MINKKNKAQFKELGRRDELASRGSNHCYHHLCVHVLSLFARTKLPFRNTRVQCVQSRKILIFINEGFRC